MKRRAIPAGNFDVKKGCVVVADGARARIFSADSRGRLRALHVLVNPEMLLEKKELVRDKHGKKRPLQGATERRQAFDEIPRRFARSISECLEKMRAENEFDSVIVAANPKFLGLLRSQMTKDTKRLVESWINRDLTVLPQREIASEIRSRT